MKCDGVYIEARQAFVFNYNSIDYLPEDHPDRGLDPSLPKNKQTNKVLI